MIEILEPELEIVDAEPVDEDVASHVQHHIDTHDISDHVSHLGEQVGQADEKLASHLHSKFDHKVGQMDQSEGFAGGETGPVEPIAPDAGGKGVSVDSIVQMLRSPQSIRQAIILSEILNPPQQRW